VSQIEGGYTLYTTRKNYSASQKQFNKQPFFIHVFGLNLSLSGEGIGNPKVGF
jgi:hypothetical protein